VTVTVQRVIFKLHMHMHLLNLKEEFLTSKKKNFLFVTVNTRNFYPELVIFKLHIHTHLLNLTAELKKKKKKKIPVVTVILPRVICIQKFVILSYIYKCIYLI
jgi:N-acetylglucosamine-6-phosphate deacetylase